MNNIYHILLSRQQFEFQICGPTSETLGRGRGSWHPGEDSRLDFNTSLPILGQCSLIRQDYSTNPDSHPRPDINPDSHPRPDTKILGQDFRCVAGCLKFRQKAGCAICHGRYQLAKMFYKLLAIFFFAGCKSGKTV